MAAVILSTAPAAQGVPIDLTHAYPAVTGPTTLHIDGIETLGSSYWADFTWNSGTNKFDVEKYGEEPEIDYLLDKGYGTANAAYSLRKLREQYRGNCLKIRRASDNVEADVAFDLNGALSGTSAITVTHGSYEGPLTLAALCSETDGFVVTWYDQAGTGPYDGRQHEAIFQPKVVSQGSVITDNGEAAIEFDGSDDYLALGEGLFGDVGLGAGDMSIWTVASLDWDPIEQERHTLIGEGTASPANFFLSYGDKIGVYVLLESGVPTARYYRVSTAANAGLALRDIGGIPRTQQQVICAYTWNGTTNELSTDANVLTRSNSIPSPQISYQNASIGAASSNPGSEAWRGKISEIVQWHSDQTANRVDISRNLNNYYKAY